MNPSHQRWRLAVPVACLLALLLLTGPSWLQAGDKGKEKVKQANGGQDKAGDKGKEKVPGGEKAKDKGPAAAFEKITFEAGELEKTFKVLKVDAREMNQGFVAIRWSLVAKQKIAGDKLNELLNKTEVRFYADDIIVGRYRLQPDNPEQTQRGLVQDEKLVLQVQLAPDAARKLAEEKPSRAALVKLD